MSDNETTPLTSTSASAAAAAAMSSAASSAVPLQGPAYVFPGGVSPRSRRNKMQRFQCCIGFTLLLIVIAALLIALALTDNYIESKTPILLLAANETAQPPAAPTAPLADEPSSAWALSGSHMNHTHSEQAVSVGIKALGDRELLEEGLQAMPVNSPAFRHYRSLSTNAEGRKLARRGYVENQATLHIAHALNYTKAPGRSDIGRGPPIPLLPDPRLNVTCDFNARYRTPNGYCNNKARPRSFGAAMTAYRRMVAPDYSDGIAQPRAAHATSVAPAQPLPSARDVSLRIHRASYDTDSNFTVMLAVFGQFLDHDITATSQTASQEGESINCCAVAPPSPSLQPPGQHPECFPVPIMPDDPYYEAYNVTCLNFVRSAPAPTGHFGPRQQLNQATAFIDGSAVYGNTVERQRSLRTMHNGTLRMFVTPDGRELLPLSTNPDDGCNRAEMAESGRYCFESGDDRANENLLLTSMHLLWARHHNYLATGLQQANPQWGDEIVFQEARRLLSAQIAHITYNEFLPILLGRETAARKGLLPRTRHAKEEVMEEAPGGDTYDQRVDPTVANCFAASAFRFAHTLLPGLFNMTRENRSVESVELHKMLFNPFSLWAERGIDHALAAAANTPVQRVDRFFSLEVTQKLFEGTAEDRLPICGLDLVSLNIQRGRDHGLPAYPVYRRHCRLPPVDTWEQMAGAVDASSLQSIREIYKSPQDVDVYTGALSEPPLENAIFGPLLTCMVSDQFMRLKKGDSYWYERTIGPQRFTKAQLKEIYKTTLAEIICRNADDVQRVHKYVMERRKEEANVYVQCSEVVSFDFRPWTEAAQPAQRHNVAVSRQMSLVRVMQQAVGERSTPHNNNKE